MKTIRIDDLKHNRVLENKIIEEIKAMLQTHNGIYDLFKYKQCVEDLYAKYLGRKYCYLVDSGTSALQLALFLLGIKEGDEVIVPVVTHPSTALVVMSLGARPVFIDIKKDLTIDEDKLVSIITDRAKAIIPVHMFGQSCNMCKIKRICSENDIKIVEDACEAQGSTYNNLKLGNFSHISTFSFDPHKTLSSIGTGGALCFDDPEFVDRIKRATTVKYGDKELLSLNRFPARMSYLDMCTLKVKLKYSKLIESDKLKNKLEYEKRLKDNPNLKIILDSPNQVSVRQHYVVLVKEKDELFSFLKSRGIYCNSPYLPLHMLDVFKEIANGKFPNAEEYFKECLLLPLYTFMAQEEIKIVCDAITEFYGRPQ